MRGPPSKSRGHRTPASSLLDRRHRCWIPTNGETHNPEPTHNHNHTSSLSVGHQAKNELCSARGSCPALQKLSRVPNLTRDQPTQRTRGNAPARSPTRILVGGSEALNHVVADTGGRGRAHVDAAKFGAVGNQRPVVKPAPRPPETPRGALRSLAPGHPSQTPPTPRRAGAPVAATDEGLERRPRRAPGHPSQTQARHAAPPGI